MSRHYAGTFFLRVTFGQLNHWMIVMKHWRYFILVLFITGFIACNNDSDSSIPETSSNINVFQTVPDKEFDAVIDTTTIGSDLAYGDNTGYHAFLAKRYTLLLYPAGSRTTPTIGGQISLRNGHYYSVFLSANNQKQLQLLAVEDRLGSATPGYGRMRFINLSDTYVNAATRLTMDVYLDTVRYFRRQSYLAATDFVEVPAGTHLLKINYADSSKVLFGAGSYNMEIADQKQYTIIGYGNALNTGTFNVTEFVH
jgi:hypothetical protein